MLKCLATVPLRSAINLLYRCSDAVVGSDRTVRAPRGVGGGHECRQDPELHQEYVQLSVKASLTDKNAKLREGERVEGNVWGPNEAEDIAVYAIVGLGGKCRE